MSQHHIYHSKYKTHIVCKSRAEAEQVFEALKKAGKSPIWYTTKLLTTSAV